MNPHFSIHSEGTCRLQGRSIWSSSWRSSYEDSCSKRQVLIGSLVSDRKRWVHQKVCSSSSISLSTICCRCMQAQTPVSSFAASNRLSISAFSRLTVSNTARLISPANDNAAPRVTGTHRLIRRLLRICTRRTTGIYPYPNKFWLPSQLKCSQDHLFHRRETLTECSQQCLIKTSACRNTSEPCQIPARLHPKGSRKRQNGSVIMEWWSTYDSFISRVGVLRFLHMLREFFDRIDNSFAITFAPSPVAA
jgi:hypothetical protein